MRFKTELMTLFQDVVYLIRPRDKTEGSFPFIIPLNDEVNSQHISNLAEREY